MTGCALRCPPTSPVRGGRERGIGSATAARRRLCTELARLRATLGLTQTQVARAHEWSPSKVHRIEHGHVTLSRLDLLALLTHYGVTDADTVDALLQLARSARNQPPAFAAYRDILTPGMRRFLGDEATACHIRQVDLMAVPELLQTPDYTRAWLREVDGLDDARTADRILDIRAVRRNRLHHPGGNGVQALFLLDEAVLQRPVGGPATMRAQLAHLVDTAERPAVQIRVLPLARGAHPGLRGPVVHLKFRDDTDSDLVYLTDHTGDPTLDTDEASTTAHLALIRQVENLAAPAVQLATYVKRAADGV